MVKNLVIVESPAKAKTIEGFLGKDFVVKSSYGHVMDLNKTKISVDVEQDFEPKYEVSADKKKLVAELKKMAKEAEMVWLASDEDREGEAISWHLFKALGLKENKTKRIVFHEITKNAILHAIENPRDIDRNLVSAQQARRVLDRLVGYELSPLLWKKVKPSLSAGRVQSVSVRIIVERERDIINFKSSSSYKTSAIFNIEDSGKKYELKADLNKRFNTKNEAEAFLKSCENSKFVVNNIEQKPGKKSPAAPFTTSTLQQEASRKLGFSVSKTMTVAQRLYEAGHITYMRTDSVNLSDLAIGTSKALIKKLYGEEFSKVRKYSSKAKGAQEAHEAIRPTYVENERVSSSSDEQRLYDLIRKRTIASQMADAVLERTTITIDVPGNATLNFQTKGEVVTFDGFLKVYIESTDDDIEESTEGLLPPIKKGANLDVQSIIASELYSKHPARYTEASLVRKLEELGIGRPSTYAPTISTIQKRGYVVKEDRDGEERELNVLELRKSKITSKIKVENAGAEKSKLFPTDIGMVVNDFLVKYFDKILDYNFTANVEKEFDEIALGKADWRKMLTDFYSPFHSSVEDTLENSERGDGERILGNDPETGKQISVRIGKFGPMVQLGVTSEDDDEKPTYASLERGQLLETITFEEALIVLKNGNDGRLLGVDPKTGKNLYSKVGRFGPFVQIGETDDEDKRYVSLLKGQRPESITLDEALVLIKLPRDLGLFEDKKVTVNIGRFGPYITHNAKFTSLKKADPDVFDITLEEAIERIVAKREQDEKRHIKSFDEDDKLRVLLDRWGKPCILYKRKYHRLSKDVVPEKLTLEECYKIVGVK